MFALPAGRALLQACRHGSLPSVKACTARVLAIQNPNQINPALKMAMGEAAFAGHTNTLRYLMATLPAAHWQGAAGPWDPLVTVPLDVIPKEWRGAAISDYVVYIAAAGGASDTIQALLNSGLKLDHRAEQAGSSLGIAVTHKKLNLVRFLLAKGADPNQILAFPPISLLCEAAQLRR